MYGTYRPTFPDKTVPLRHPRKGKGSHPSLPPDDPAIPAAFGKYYNSVFQAIFLHSTALFLTHW